MHSRAFDYVLIDDISYDYQILIERRMSNDLAKVISIRNRKVYIAAAAQKRINLSAVAIVMECELVRMLKSFYVRCKLPWANNAYSSDWSPHET